MPCYGTLFIRTRMQNSLFKIFLTEVGSQSEGERGVPPLPWSVDASTLPRFVSSQLEKA